MTVETRTKNPAEIRNGTSAWRVPLVMPVAAVMTAGLMLSMAHLIATEFTPQDKSENLSFQINPVEECDCISPIIEAPEDYVKVEIPPPPPSTGFDDVDAVDVPPVKVAGPVTLLSLPPIDLGPTTFVEPDKNATPIVRIPPVMPARFQQGNVSGFCDMRFNVSPEGQPYDVMAVHCTDSVLSRPSKKAVLKWKYNPKVQDGRAVARQGVETKIRFNLADERGKRLPLPAGY